MDHGLCNCCDCTNHSSCPTILNPRWITLMPMKINEILIGPIHPLPGPCLYEIKELLCSNFTIVQKYIYPNFLTKMVTLSFVTKSPIILKPGEPLVNLCVVHFNDLIDDLKGNKEITNKNTKKYKSCLFLFIMFSRRNLLF
jgi:hypothetical protein